jgi:hypothetical protein
MVASKKGARPAFRTLEEEVEWYETNDSWDDEDEEVEVETKVPLDTVVPVRVTSDFWRALHREARELGIGPTTLARMWLLEKLRAVEAGRRSSGVAEPSAQYIARRKAASKTTPSPAQKAARKAPAKH